MPRRNTLPNDVNALDDNPLSVIVREDAGRGSQARGRAPSREERKSRQASTKKERVAFYLSEDLADEIRNAVVHFSGPPLRLTMTSVAEMAFQKELERLKTEYNGGKPFPKRDEDLKGGRPIR
jgi:hypothetical protein